MDGSFRKETRRLLASGQPAAAEQTEWGGLRAAGGRNRWGGHAVALAFCFYAFILAPPLASALKTGLVQPEPLWGAGAFLLAVLLLEPFGLRWKLQFLRRRNRDDGFAPEGSLLGLFSAVFIGHVIVTVVVLDCWGGESEERALGVMATALLVKEFAALFACGGTRVAREPPGHWKEHLADLLLLAYGCVAYTVWWVSLLDLGDVAAEGWRLKLLLLPVLLPLFLFLFLPMRLPVLLEECHLRPKPGRTLRLAAELALGAVVGLYPAL